MVSSPPGPAAPSDLLRSDAVLRALADALHEGLVLLDTRGRVESCNPAAAEIIGCVPEDLLGRPFSAVVGAEHEDGAPMPEAQRPSRRALRGEVVTDDVVRIPRAGGVHTWVRVNARPLCEPGSATPTGALLSFVDVTDLRASLHQMRDAEARFRKMVAKSSDMVVVTDERGVLTYVSPAVGRTLGYAEDEKLGTSMFELVHPDDAALAIERFVRVASADAEPQPLELRVKDAEGRWRPLEVLASNLLADDDVRGIVINARDVTERRRVEAALDEVQQRFRAAFERAPLGVAFIGLDGAILQVNGAYCDIVGYDESELVGVDARAFVHEDSLESWVPVDDEPSFVTGREIRVRRRDGGTQWVLASWSLLHDEHGDPSYAILVIADITARKLLEARLAHDARHDPLTGLMNRACFLDRLDQALARARRDPRTVAVLFLDLDRFKIVNDTLGHEAGDDLLAEVAHRLRCSVREADTVARLGGDEFVVLCEGVESVEQVSIAAERIRALVEAPVALGGHLVYVGASVGIAVAEPGQRGADLMRNSDVAVYRAKARGRSRTEFFDEQMRAEDDRRLETEVELRHAVARGEITAWFQPVVDVRSAQVVGFEALARWRHPTRGLLEPADFMAVAEETGLVHQLGLGVIEAAWRQQVEWRDLSPAGLLRMSVNLSPRQLSSPDLVESLRRILGETGAEPSELCLEVTESCVMRDLDNALDVLRELRALGVGLAIDDFGTGESSLTCLRRLPIDCVKLDRTFGFELGIDAAGARIVAAVVDLAHALGLTVVAEGVESREHFGALVNLGCDLAQGWFLAPALDRDRATRVLTEGIRAPREDA
jgi:diguanylate cyclase (GGDEF)-like protein/PAS domain S-box-containing protein